MVLAGFNHLQVVLNKVDQLDNNVDFARAFGTLGWALSKVIPQKESLKLTRKDVKIHECTHVLIGSHRISSNFMAVSMRFL